MQLVKRYGKKGAMLFLAGIATTPAFAVGPDFSALTASIDFSTAIVAILAAFAAVGAVVVVMKGGSMILAAMKK